MDEGLTIDALYRARPDSHSEKEEVEGRGSKRMRSWPTSQEKDRRYRIKREITTRRRKELAYRAGKGGEEKVKEDMN